MKAFQKEKDKSVKTRGKRIYRAALREIEIAVDGEGKVWFASSAPIFEEEKKPADTLCG